MLIKKLNVVIFIECSKKEYKNIIISAGYASSLPHIKSCAKNN